VPRRAARAVVNCVVVGSSPSVAPMKGGDMKGKSTVSRVGVVVGSSARNSS